MEGHSVAAWTQTPPPHFCSMVVKIIAMQILALGVSVWLFLDIIQDYGTAFIVMIFFILIGFVYWLLVSFILLFTHSPYEEKTVKGMPQAL